MEGRGYGNDEKGVEVADNVNEGITETVFDRDYEPRCPKQWLIILTHYLSILTGVLAFVLCISSLLPSSLLPEHFSRTW